MTISIIFVMRYAKRVQENPMLSIVGAEHRELFANAEHMAESDGTAADGGSIKMQGSEGENTPAHTNVMSGRQKAILAVFGGCFFIMILGVIPWAEKFDIYFFENINEFLRGIPVLGVVLGNTLRLENGGFPILRCCSCWARSYALSYGAGMKPSLQNCL